jgi:hypothetical protein
LTTRQNKKFNRTEDKKNWICRTEPHDGQKVVTGKEKGTGKQDCQNLTTRLDRRSSRTGDRNSKLDWLKRTTCLDRGFTGEETGTMNSII